MEINSALTQILLKIAIFGILAKFKPIVSGEGMKMVKKPEDMLKTIVIALQKPKQNWKSSFGTPWD